MLFLGMSKLIAFILLFNGTIVFAQNKIDTLVHSEKPGVATKNIRICAPSRVSQIQKEPLFVIKHGKKEHLTNNYNNLNPDHIEALSIFKDSASIAKYGNDGKYGVIIITLKKDKISGFREGLRKFKDEKK